jgi:DNA-binding MarR family transcriptional regulator
MHPDEKLIVGIVRVSESYQKDCSALFKEYGLTFAQYGVLRALDGSNEGRNSITNVSKVMLVSGANMTGISRRLEKGGFLSRNRVPDDDRMTILEITEKGKRILREMEKDKESIITKYLKGFPESLKQDFLSLVRETLNRVR